MTQLDEVRQAEIKHAYDEICREFFTCILTLHWMQSLEEFNFFKGTFTSPEGGTYLLSIQHVDGPKIVAPERRREEPPESSV
jgi:hypothetical protein